MMRKGQLKRSGGKDAAGQAKFVATLFRVAAWQKSNTSLRLSNDFSKYCVERG